MVSSRVDEQTKAYLAEHCKKEYHVYEADEDAVYEDVIEIDLSEVLSDRCIPTSSGQC